MPTSLTDLLGSSKKDVDIEQKIVEELLNDKNLDTKTELTQPIKWVTLDSITDFLKGKNMIVSSGILNRFMNVAFKYLISKDRKGRLEYIQALQSIKEKQIPENSNLSMKVTP